MTGEINLQGRVTEIGGLEQKILGGIRAGVKTFLYPSENARDFEKLTKKCDTNRLLEGIEFIAVSDIDAVFEELFSEKN